MITGELKRQVDKIWDTLWTPGITSPVTVMEQITYLLFMKLLDDNQLARDPKKPSDRKAKCFFVPKGEIAGNDYDLSINKYKTVEYVAETFPPVSAILAEFEKAEREIQSAFVELKGMP